MHGIVKLVPRMISPLHVINTRSSSENTLVTTTVIFDLQQMTPRETVSFVSPRSPMFSEAKVERKQNSLFPAGPVTQCFFIPLNSKTKKLRKNHMLDASLLTNLPRFQRPDHVRVESSSCCFPRELVSFDPWHRRDTLSSNLKTYLSWEVLQYYYQQGFSSSSYVFSIVPYSTIF